MCSRIFRQSSYCVRNLTLKWVSLATWWSSNLCRHFSWPEKMFRISYVHFHSNFKKRITYNVMVLMYVCMLIQEYRFIVKAIAKISLTFFLNNKTVFKIYWELIIWIKNLWVQNEFQAMMTLIKYIYLKEFSTYLADHIILNMSWIEKRLQKWINHKYSDSECFSTRLIGMIYKNIFLAFIFFTNHVLFPYSLWKYLYRQQWYSRKCVKYQIQKRGDWYWLFIMQIILSYP